MKRKNMPGKVSMGRKNRSLLGSCMMVLLFMLTACAQLSPTPAGVAAGGSGPTATAAASQPAPAATSTTLALALPVRFQKPAYLVKDMDAGDAAQAGGGMSVGADISSIRPMSLREVLKILVDLKKMTVSWASDVDQNILVDVNIGADDDFFAAIDNLLRQVDYFHEVSGNTIVVRYNETRKFHVAMPFMNANYATSVGGNVLGGTTASNQISSQNNPFDIWKNIQDNLDKVLEIYSATEVVSTTTPALAEGEAASTEPASTEPAVSAASPSPAKGYYTIDKPIGLVTVTAPRPLLEKIATYFNNLKEGLYKQISIEVKIIEVTLTDTSSIGIDWTNLLGSIDNTGTATGGQTITFSLFNGGQLYPKGASVVNTVTGLSTFNLLLRAIEMQGDARVLNNPRIVTMNGQPAMISVGKDMTYISKVESTIDDVGNVTITASTDSIFSGLGLGVVPMISDNDEIILSLTPVISQLEGDVVAYKDFGVNNTIGIPVVNMREMTSIARIKSGEMLVVGGFIKETDSETDVKFPILGDIPVVGRLFKQSTKFKPRVELIIMLQPRIL